MNSSVIAACDIPEGMCSLPGVGEINMRCLLEKTTARIYFHAHILDGHLSLVNMQDEKNWARLVAVAKNCHEQNVELRKSQQGLILRTTRHIQASDELLVWIGSDLLMQLEYPFLKPVNIKGNQTYYCHQCGEVFQNPNPLKVHLSFQCLMTSSSRYSLEKIKSDSQLDLKSVAIAQHSFEAFRNLERLARNNNTMPPQLLPLDSKLDAFSFCGKRDSQMRTMSTEETLDTHSFDLSFGINLSVTSPAAHSKVGNKSRPPPGHVCGYCGKVYSRKYGLKIHVRTHTGYKPLKCKFCFRSFSDPSNLNKHVRLHSEADTPYRCPVCGKVLVRRRDLQRHIKSRHSGTEWTEK